jgi:hypothetical protein
MSERRERVPFGRARDASVAGVHAVVRSAAELILGPCRVTALRVHALRVIDGEKKVLAEVSVSTADLPRSHASAIGCVVALQRDERAGGGAAHAAIVWVEATRTAGARRPAARDDATIQAGIGDVGERSSVVYQPSVLRRRAHGRRPKARARRDQEKGSEDDTMHAPSLLRTSANAARVTTGRRSTAR